MMIGRFTYDAHNDIYCGAILTLGCRTRLRISPNIEPCRDLPFDYWVEAITPLGEFMCGSGERRTASSGETYVHVTLRDPALRHPIIGYLWGHAESHAVMYAVARRHPVIEFLRSLLP